MSESLRAVGISLRSVLADAQLVGAADVRVTSCTSNIRQVRKGDVFIAVTGAEYDGHDVAADAVTRGAAAIVCERPLPVFTVPQFIVADSRAAYGTICQSLVGNPSQQLKIIGVTGTSGKTTVVRLLASILRAAGATVGTIDSLGNWDGDGRESTFDGELSPPLVARLLGEMVAAGVTHAIIEIPSDALAKSIMEGIELDAACLTHIGRDHLDLHGSVKNYRAAKARVFDLLHESGMAILNADCDDSMRILSDLDRPALTIGLKKPAEITATIIEQHVNEQTFVLTAGDESVGVRSAMVGDHHVYNCLTAAATGLAYGVELTTIARGLEAVEQLPGRMERVACGQDYSILVDAANTPDTLRTCLRAARRVTTGRVICVFGTDDDLDRHQLKVMGRVAGSLADMAVITHNAPRLPGTRDESREIVAGFADPRKAFVILDRASAIAWALSEAREGDTVVLAGTGERIYPNAIANELPCDDGGIVRHVLSGAFEAPAARRVAA